MGAASCAAATSPARAERLERLAVELHPCVIAFVGKAGYAGAFREKPALGLQERRLGETALFVLPSTSPANAAVPYAERLRWFRALGDELLGCRDRPRARLSADRAALVPIRAPRASSGALRSKAGGGTGWPRGPSRATDS